MAISPYNAGALYGPGKELRQAADLVIRHGEIMRIKRAIILPAILTLSTAGSVLAGTAMTLAATSAPGAVVATASYVHPDYVHNG